MADLSEGDEFAGYRIERRLGRGGMGILYLAVEPGLERRVALKLIAPEAASEEVFAKRFAEESRIAASIEHPNVVPIYAAGEQDGIPYIAMRYVSGSDLGQRLAREGRLDPVEAASLIAQVGNGLDAIHAAGLVHRDVKPANVLLSGGDGEPHAYITDFGVARNLATESGLTQTGRFVGTLDYVAPEQISGGDVDARVDVYALGCLLFKLLTGEVPFPRDTEAARLYAHLNDPPPAPSLYVPSVSMALDDVVIRAMSKPPQDRYPSAGDLGRAALAALSGSAVDVPERTVATGAAATRESPTEPLRGRPGRRRLALAAGPLALAAVAVAVVAVILATGNGGGGGGNGAQSQTTSSQQGAEGGQRSAPEEANPKPKPLSRSQLIAKGDEICTQSQETFKSYQPEFPNGENEPNVAYSRLLMGISSKAVRRFNRLVPPPVLAARYGRYVAAQEEVKRWDRDALRAAEAGDEAAYLGAREERTETEPERQQLAEAVGFRVCSGSEL
ncbi:MAG TPA: serine/threonine-protein kinase [Solirubrobacterales bacterium]|nr:serine/threonine-protein kinase [Solirubrobacterales bacterium]